MEYDLLWKTTFDGRQSLMENGLRWKTIPIPISIPIPIPIPIPISIQIPIVIPISIPILILSPILIPILIQIPIPQPIRKLESIGAFKTAVKVWIKNHVPRFLN